ncbi:MAG TPA: DUF4258 domain-containing protein [Pyrinomonadaceae bacterium]|nr:DUF4258 domain-containing protein [Pyrinomonadaceae bacterium]
MSPITPPRLSPLEATRKIRLLLEEGTTDYSGHCWHERMPERNVSTLDVEQVLGKGQVIRNAEWDSDFCNWKYRVEGTDIDGEELTAITVIFEQDFSLLVVTVF